MGVREKVTEFAEIILKTDAVTHLSGGEIVQRAIKMELKKFLKEIEP